MIALPAYFRSSVSPSPPRFHGVRRRCSRAPRSPATGRRDGIPGDPRRPSGSTLPRGGADRRKAPWVRLRRVLALEHTWLDRHGASRALLPISAFRFNRQAELLRLELVATHGLEIAWKISRTVPLHVVHPRTGNLIRVSLTGEPLAEGGETR